MKNIYELSSKERDNLRGEFNKLKFTKDINTIIGPSLIIVFACLIASMVLSDLVLDGYELKAWVEFVDNFGAGAFAVFVILEVYLNISFIRWMKIKHNIEY